MILNMTNDSTLFYLAVDVLDGPDAFFKYFSYHARYRSIRSR